MTIIIFLKKKIVILIFTYIFCLINLFNKNAARESERNEAGMNL